MYLSYTVDIEFHSRMYPTIQKIWGCYLFFIYLNDFFFMCYAYSGYIYLIKNTEKLLYSEILLHLIKITVLYFNIL